MEFTCGPLTNKWIAACTGGVTRALPEGLLSRSKAGCCCYPDCSADQAGSAAMLLFRRLQHNAAIIILQLVQHLVSSTTLGCPPGGRSV
jgi:hypothetical protein